MRRTSLISPWGVGAIVPFANDESLMIAGLDMWHYGDSEDFCIKDERLQKRLGVKELRWPPDFKDKMSDPVNYGLTIPAVRFPRWYYCPFCGGMQKVTLYSKAPICDKYKWPSGRICKENSSRHLIPERFVVVCPEGHIDDFPVAEWVHNDSGKTYNPETCHIRRSTGGTSASLSGVKYKCTCGASKSIQGANQKGSLARIGYVCKGSKPWLGIEKDSVSCQCDPADLKVVQRGATNVWFADVRSSISIPTDDEAASRRIIKVVNECYGVIRRSRLNGEINTEFLRHYADEYKVDYQELYDAVKAKIDAIEGLPEVSTEMTEDEYRIAEYRKLTRSSGSDSMDFYSINYPIEKYGKSIRSFFSSISLVKKLRETRAFVGFSRLEPNGGGDFRKKMDMLRLGRDNWLPAIEVYGEGIFFEFNHAAIVNWAKASSVQKRIGNLSRAFNNSFFTQNDAEQKQLRPEYVLLHTFAHLIINQLSFECGYGSSALRERIYCEKCSDDSEMCGVLIYTASGDSEGSLGGLVRQGEPGRIEDTILSALQNAEWCSSDPVCIQSVGQGPDSLNLAACHNCALLPETCCENGNRLLDRGVIIGTLDDNALGFFSSYKKLIN